MLRSHSHTRDWVTSHSGGVAGPKLWAFPVCARGGWIKVSASRKSYSSSGEVDTKAGRDLRGFGKILASSSTGNNYLIV